MPRELKHTDVTHLILHCSDSEWGQDSDINEWHRQRGFDYAGGTYIGYHFIILNGIRRYVTLKDGHRVAEDDGTVQVARPACWWGCHALGYNDRSLGICLIGVRSFTPKQFDATKRLCLSLMEQYKILPERVLGHCETALSNGKTCPNFDVTAFRRTLVA